MSVLGKCAVYEHPAPQQPKTSAESPDTTISCYELPHEHGQSIMATLVAAIDRRRLHHGHRRRRLVRTPRAPERSTNHVECQEHQHA